MPEEAPGRYEASSTNVVAIAGLNASLKGLDINEHRKTLRELTEYLLEALNGIPSVNLMGTFDTDKTLGIVSFVVEGYQSDEVGIILDDEYDIAVRTGYHCAPYIHIDSDGNRISFTGSMNESSNGFDENFESIYTFCSWKDQSQIDAVAEAERDFDNNWIDNTKKLKVVPFPDIIIDKLLNFRKSTVDYTTDEREYGYRSYIKKNAKFHMPDYVKMRGYQDTANDQ